jgi:hypothetical protein
MESNRRGFLGALAAASPAVANLLKDVPEVKAVERITPEPNTGFVLSFPSQLSGKNIERIQTMWKHVFAQAGIDAPFLLILDGGATLEAIPALKRKV